MNNENKGWEGLDCDFAAMVTLQAMTRCAGADGIVTATIEQLAARADLPVEIIENGLAELQRPIVPGFARITRLRDFSGWQISNYGAVK